ncbi:MAG: methyl-accepting chemotaxis protein [Gemmatimonadetes bacterium]|nr:methyl-accepting chemotaxis protein [Gemmatimonadota bacterium]
MTWTVGQRIALALALELALLAVVAIVGASSLGKTTEAYESALTARRTTLVPALRAESQLKEADINHLRTLVSYEPRFEHARDSLLASARGLILQLRDTVQSDQEKERWSTASSLLAQWTDGLLAAAAASKANDQAAVLRIRTTRTQPIGDSLYSTIQRGVADATRRSDTEARVGQTTAQGARGTVVLTALLAIVLGLIAGYFVSRSITRPLQETANVIASSSSEILSATTEQAAGTNESMAAVTETVATVDEVAQTATQSAQRARTVADAAQRASEGGRAGQKAVDDAVKAMQLVQSQVETMAHTIVALAEQAQAIGEITTAVSDIAEQTKLLALNAAVESTRAGEHGRGFALVAAEIKTLAGEAKESTVQVRRLLGEIQRSTSAAVMATEQGTKQTAAAVRQVNSAGEIISQLAMVVDEAAQAAAQIVASAGQQALGMDQIRQAIANIHDATQQNLTATHQSETAAQNLNELGTQLVGMVGARGR